MIANANCEKSYLRAKKEESILTSIEASIRSTALDFDRFVNDTVSLDWAARKEQICQVFGLAAGKPRVAEDVHTTATATNAPGQGPGWPKRAAGPVTGNAFVDVDAGASSSSSSSPETAKKYREVVQELNKARQQANKQYNLAQRFHDVARTLGTDVRAQQMQDIWRIMLEVTGEDGGVAAMERKYAAAYAAASAADQSHSRAAMNLRRRIVSGSKRFLEKQFLEQLELNIARNPIEAQLGGVPSVYNKMRAALNLRFAEGGRWVHPTLEIVNNVPVWALIYYMIRSGCLKEALEFTLSNRDAFQKLGTSFPVYLKAYVESPVHGLPSTLLENIRKEFNEQVRFFDEETSDPYKFALYKVIGRCELSKKSFPGVIETTEDWLWIHFSLIYEDTTEIRTLYDKYTLQNLQQAIVSFGPKYFDPDHKSPGLYVQVLVMCGLFEQAVQYTYGVSVVEAVHLAIALSYYGLIRASGRDAPSDQLLVNDRELNFSRLVIMYTRSFRLTEPVDAVEYLVLISLNQTGADDEQVKMCHEALKELVLETREFAKLLGDVRADGTRSPGAIEQRLALIGLDTVDAYLYAITEQAAIKAEVDGRTADAVLLYQLAEDYDMVVSIINKSLGEAISETPLGQAVGGGSANGGAEDPAELARRVMDVYTRHISIFHRVKPRNRDTCSTLLTLVRAWSFFSAGDVEQCLRCVSDTNILMLDSRADISSVRSRAQQFSTLDHSVARNVPALLVMVMRCCSSIKAGLDQSQYHNEGRAARLAEMQGVSRNCMVYAGMIQYRMPREVFVELTNLEIRM